MNDIYVKRCQDDEEYAQALLFILKRRYDLHGSLSTLDVVTMVHHYITQGQLVRVTNRSGEPLAIAAYYYGSPELGFEDKLRTVTLDQVIIAREHRGTRLFLRGFRQLLEQIVRDNPQVDEFRFAALADNPYLRRLYSKFADITGIRDGEPGKQHVYCVKINRLIAYLDRVSKV